MPDNDEVKAILALYASLCSEIISRHQDRYRFITLSLPITAALGVFFTLSPQVVSEHKKLLVLALAPIPFIASMGLILKEHQYINMRDWYLRDVLWPRIEELTGVKKQELHWLGWNEFESLQMGRSEGLPRRKERLWVFGILGLFDYSIPGIFAAGGIAAYWVFYKDLSDHWSYYWINMIAGTNTLLFITVVLLATWLRVKEQKWYPSIKELRSSEKTKLKGEKAMPL
jgi:hypothetical protein